MREPGDARNLLFSSFSVTHRWALSKYRPLLRVEYAP